MNGASFRIRYLSPEGIEGGGVGPKAGLPGSTADFELWVQQNKGIIARLDEEGLVDFKINTEGSGVRGTDVFKRMMQHFGDKPNGVWGKWVRGTNLDKVNQLTAQGVPLEEAVTHAWTANRARDFGFGKASIIKAEGSPGVYTNIELKFTR